MEERKKAKAGYQAYDDEAELEAAALGLHKPVLAKYDDEIDQHKRDKSRGFVIGDAGAAEAQRFKDLMVSRTYRPSPLTVFRRLTSVDSKCFAPQRQERLQGGVNKRLETLRLPDLQIAQEYLNEHEIQAKFKKPKRKVSCAHIIHFNKKKRDTNGFVVPRGAGPRFVFA